MKTSGGRDIQIRTNGGLLQRNTNLVITFSLSPYASLLSLLPVAEAQAKQTAVSTQIMDLLQLKAPSTPTDQS